jgi:hypothetical protein
MPIEKRIGSSGQRAIVKGRQRLNPDGTIQSSKAPRGLPLATGEDRIRQRSGNARCLPTVFACERETPGQLGTIDPKILTECQTDGDAGLYAEATAAFVQWLAPRIEQAREDLATRAAEVRPLASRKGDHARTPDIVAELVAAFDLYIAFALEAGDQRTRGRQHKLAVWDGLMENAAEARIENQEEGTPAERYLGPLGHAISSAKGYLVDAKTGDVSRRPRGSVRVASGIQVPGR